MEAASLIELADLARRAGATAVWPMALSSNTVPIFYHLTTNAIFAERFCSAVLPCFLVERTGGRCRADS